MVHRNSASSPIQSAIYGLHAVVSGSSASEKLRSTYRSLSRRRAFLQYVVAYVSPVVEQDYTSRLEISKNYSNRYVTLTKELDVVNFKPHSQTNGCSPVCTRKCVSNSPLETNCAGQW